MQGIRPQQLSDEEFLKYAYLQGYGKLDEEWTYELLKRLERLIKEKDAHLYTNP
jgi:hypothetical protein